MKPHLRILRSLLLFSALWVINCIYTFGAGLPKNYNRVYFQIPENRTGYPLVQDISLSHGLSFIRSDGRLKITDSSNAYLMIKTELNSYIKSPEQYDNQGKVISYRLVLSARVEFFDLKNGKDFVPPVSLSGNALWFPDNEGEEGALRRAVEDLYRQAIRYLFSQTQW